VSSAEHKNDQLDGLVVVDKPGGMTSHDVVSAVRRAAGQRRIGHGGTLDPLATGVLPLLLGRATRLLRYLPDRPKVYATRIRLGLETQTGDRDGEIIAHKPVDVSDAALREALDRLVGDIAQVPPMYSAKKVAGVRLYRAARAGLTVEREAVRVRVEEIRVLLRDGDDVDLEIHCSAGTYVRSIATDHSHCRSHGSTSTDATVF